MTNYYDGARAEAVRAARSEARLPVAPKGPALSDMLKLYEMAKDGKFRLSQGDMDTLEAEIYADVFLELLAVEKAEAIEDAEIIEEDEDW